MTSLLFIPWLLLPSVLASPPSPSAVPVPSEAGRPSSPPDAVTARGRVSLEDLESWLRYGPASGTLAEDPRARRRQFEELLLAEALAGEARRRRLDRTPTARILVAQAEARLAEGVLRRHLADNLEIDDAEVRRVATTETFGLPRRFRIRHIFKAFPPEAGDAERKRLRREMEALRERSLAGEDFSELAERESQSSTRRRGGLLGNVAPGALSPDLDAVVTAMEPGETSNVLPSARGLTLLYCEYILPPLERSPEEIQQLARERVEGRTFGARWSELEARLRDEGNLRIHWKRLGGETRTDGAGEEPFAEAVGEGWTVSDLEALLGEELVGTPHGDDRRRLEDRIEGFLIDRLKIREVWLRGLAGDPAMTDGRRWVETQILAGQAMIALVAERVEPPTAPQIETHYAAHADAFVTEERFRLSLISVAKGEDPAAAADLLWSIRHSLRADPDRFGALALIHSTDPSAARGGDLGWVPRGRLARGMGLDALQEVISLGNGEISEMIDGGDAFQLLRLEDREAPRTQTLQEAWPRVENRIGQARVERARREIAEEWLEALEIRWPESEDRP